MANNWNGAQGWVRVNLYDGAGNPVTQISGGVPVYLLNGGGGGTASNFGVAFPASGTAVGASDGTNMQPLLVDGSGNLKVAGSLTVTPVTSTTASSPSQQTIGTSAGQVLAANSGRKRLMLQNVGTTVIKIAYGAVPTSSNYHFSLPAGGSANDGSSPIWQDTMWLGAIQAISSGAGGLLQVTELT